MEHTGTCAGVAGGGARAAIRSGLARSAGAGWTLNHHGRKRRHAERCLFTMGRSGGEDCGAVEIHDVLEVRNAQAEELRTFFSTSSQRRTER